MHQLVFDGIMLELSEQNSGGFNSDYLHLTDKAELVRSGRQQFHCEFPKKAPPPPRQTKSKSKNNAEGTTSSSAKKKTIRKIKEKETTSRTGAKLIPRNGKHYVPDIDDFEDGADMDEDDSVHEVVERKVGSKARSPASAGKSVLPAEHTESLMKRIKKLVTMWADEERMNGNSVFCAYPQSLTVAVDCRLHFFPALIPSTSSLSCFRRLEHHEQWCHVRISCKMSDVCGRTARSWDSRREQREGIW